MTFSLRNEYYDCFLLIDADSFFPCPQDRMRKLWANWIYPIDTDVGTDIVNYLANRMDQIKQNWMDRNIPVEDYPKQDEASEYRKLERNQTLLITLIKGGKHYGRKNV